MKRWEYLVLDLGNNSANDDQDALAPHGMDGWELVSVLFSGKTFAYLKRSVRLASEEK